jgi:hypothetical protein
MSSFDPLLAPLLEARDEDRERVAAGLVTRHVDPIVQRIVRRRLGWSGEAASDLEDVRSEVRLQLLARLEEFRADPLDNGIANLEGYVAVAAYHACDQYLRRRYPLRARLKNRLRYALSHSPRLGLWPAAAEGALVGGLQEWRERAAFSRDVTRLQTLKADPHAVAATLGIEDGGRSAPVALLERLFAWIGHPLELDELVGVIAALWGVHDAEPTPLPDDEQLADRGPTAHGPAGSSGDPGPFLARLWSEVQLLPGRQRAALLLNLRDERGGDLLDLLVLTRTATVEALAEALAMATDELSLLWPRLPLHDLEIAERLGASRQQVINLRKCARERLARRLRDLRP